MTVFRCGGRKTNNGKSNYDGRIVSFFLDSYVALPEMPDEKARPCPAFDANNFPVCCHQTEL
jgi:hypothetical protein